MQVIPCLGFLEKGSLKPMASAGALKRSHGERPRKIETPEKPLTCGCLLGAQQPQQPESLHSSSIQELPQTKNEGLRLRGKWLRFGEGPARPLPPLLLPSGPRLGQLHGLSALPPGGKRERQIGSNRVKRRGQRSPERTYHQDRFL